LGLCAPSAAADQEVHVHSQKKSLEKTIQDEEAAIADVTEAIATLKDEIAAFIASIAALDQAVAEATEHDASAKGFALPTCRPSPNGGIRGSNSRG